MVVMCLCVSVALDALPSTSNLRHLIRSFYFGDVSTAYFRIISDGLMSSEREVRKKEEEADNMKQNWCTEHQSSLEVNSDIRRCIVTGRNRF